MDQKNDDIDEILQSNETGNELEIVGKLMNKIFQNRAYLEEELEKAEAEINRLREKLANSEEERQKLIDQFNNLEI